MINKNAFILKSKRMNTKHLVSGLQKLYSIIIEASSKSSYSQKRKTYTHSEVKLNYWENREAGEQS